MSKYFVQVDVKKYVDRQIEYGILKPFFAEKVAPVMAREGFLGEQVTTYTKSGMVETINTVGISADNQLDMVVTKMRNGEVDIDEFGHENSWIVKRDVFAQKYEPVNAEKNIYKTTGGIQQFVEVLENITFLAPWKEATYLLAGGYLNITNREDIYGISKEDFEETYQIQEETKMKNKKW